MSNNVTLNELISVFKDISNRHKQINDFGFGTTDQIGESRKMVYPYLWTTVTNSSSLVLQEIGSTVAYIDFNIILIVADKVNNTLNTTGNLGEDSNNGLEVSSDCLQIINDIVAEISTHPYYNKNDIKITEDIILNPTWDEDDGIVNAWTAELTIRMPFRLTYCGSPLKPKS